MAKPSALIKHLNSFWGSIATISNQIGYNYSSWLSLSITIYPCPPQVSLSSMQIKVTISRCNYMLWLGKIAKSLFIFLFFFFWYYYTRKKCGKVPHDKCHTSHHISGSHRVMSHDECRKIVHRPYSSCISSVQEMEEDSIEFSLSTWTWRMIKSSQAKSLH